ncbi:hypothetical protein [Roseiconus lacunae]|uniref:Uncharacterized protein n=1 Tax=Roseiconus lacunae TaxID=2605694 RepID=A0ABT7PLT9_9BACT|nr:hypothetical protein [Roseiconus lacunae]MDM4017246.1 hypothetical protein [Roseiconus lacunae]
MSNRILNVFPGQDDSTRLVLARESGLDGQSQLVLRQENFSPHVGWFVQSRLAMDAAQAAALKMTLTSNLMDQSGDDSERASASATPAATTLKLHAAIAG